MPRMKNWHRDRPIIGHLTAWFAEPWTLLMLLFLAATVPAWPAEQAASKKSSSRADAAAADALFTNAVVHLIKIEIPSPALWSLRREPRTYVRATVREGAAVYTNVLIRLKGGAGSFRPLNDKPGFTLKFEEANASFHGLNKVHLNNSVQDNTHLSEWLGSELFRQAGVPAARALPVLVELNGRRLGLMVLLESVDQQFLGRYFKNTHGNVYCPPGNTDITEPLDCMGGRDRKDTADLTALSAAAQKLDLAQLGRVLDVDRFLSFLALEVLLCHWDGYTFNVKNYLLFDDLNTKRMVFIPHDLDQLLQNPGWPILPDAPKGIVAGALLADRGIQRRYLERVSTLSNRVFVAPVLTRRIDALVTQLAPGLNAYDPILAQAFVRRSLGFKQRMANRIRSVQVQLAAGAR